MAILLFWCVFLFLMGLAIGSFLNVCVARLPYEKSLFWPSSRCMKCLQPIRWYDNMPIVGYLVLRGRCRSCGVAYGVRYLLVELGTGLAFVGLFLAEIVFNVLNLTQLTWAADGLFPLSVMAVVFHHAVLFCFLLVVSLCDLDDMEIPLPVTVTGTIFGLALSTLFAWPFPSVIPIHPRPTPQLYPPVPGVHAWPVWYPLPDWLPAGSLQLGLATGLAGALAGMLMLRGVRFLFGLGRGKEGLGVGDADLMMMAGAFVGWQPIIVAFFVAVLPALFFAIVHLIRKGDQALPFGPSLATGVLITVLCWPGLGEQFQQMFFDPIFLGIMGGGGAVALLMISFMLRVARGTDQPQGSNG